MADQKRIAELRSALQDEVKAMDDITDAFKVESKDESDGGGKVGIVVSTEQKDAFAKHLANAKELKGLIEMEEGADTVRDFLDGKSEGSVASEVAALMATGGYRPSAVESKSIGELFIASSEFKALQASGGLDMQSEWQFNGKDISSPERKDVYTALAPTMTSRGFGSVQIDPMVPLQMRTVRVRDLFPAQPTTANLIDFFRVSGFANSASVVPERSGGAFALKPQSTLTFALGQAPVRQIAHYEVAHRNVLSDEPQLQATINNELLYGLRLHEDYQILQGTGTSEDLLGILNTPGIQAYTQGSSPEQQADAIRKAATRVFLAYYEPTGVVVHPFDWETIELLKDSQNRYIVTGSVAVGADKTLWRMPVVDTPAIPQKTALVGAFGLGAQLYDREQASIRIAEQHSDYFTRNAVAILAEERLALACKRPESFAKVTLT